jgi:hypothetical protein
MRALPCGSFRRVHSHPLISPFARLRAPLDAMVPQRRRPQGPVGPDSHAGADSSGGRRTWRPDPPVCEAAGRERTEQATLGVIGGSGSLYELRRPRGRPTHPPIRTPFGEAVRRVRRRYARGRASPLFFLPRHGRAVSCPRELTSAPRPRHEAVAVVQLLSVGRRQELARGDLRRGQPVVVPDQFSRLRTFGRQATFFGGGLRRPLTCSSALPMMRASATPAADRGPPRRHSVRPSIAAGHLLSA